MRRMILIVITLVAVTQSAIGQEESQTAKIEQLLKIHGIKKNGRSYVLIGEDEAFRLYRQTLSAMDEANLAVAQAGELAARNESIINFQQRMAFDEGVREEMRVAMRDGKSLEEQTARRQAEADLGRAKQEMARLKQAGGAPNPRQAVMLTQKATEACAKATKVKQTLFDQVYDVDEKVIGR